MSVTVGQVRWREPRPEWQERLDAIAPPARTVSSLRLLWEAGDPWDPIERWVIWQVWPEGRLPVWVDPEGLNGPGPRSVGHYCGDGCQPNGQLWCRCEVKQHRWVGGPSNCAGISQQHYDLWHQPGPYHRRWHSRYWVMQGPYGGHRYNLNLIEQTVCRMFNRPAEMPPLGALPYCEPDERTWHALGAADQLRAHQRIKDFLEQDPAQRARDEEALIEQAAAQLMKWIDEQMEGPADRIYSALRRDSDVVRAAPWDRSATPAATEETAHRALVAAAGQRPLTAT